MTSLIAPRLRKPAVRGLAGTLLAAAFLVRGGHTWWFSILTEVAVAGYAVSLYLRGGEDSDEGALVGSRADERQQLLGLRSRALAGQVAVIAAFLGLVVTTAARTVSWPFWAMLAVTALGYGFGLSAYGSDDAGPAEERPAPRPASAPVTR